MQKSNAWNLTNARRNWRGSRLKFALLAILAPLGVETQATAQDFYETEIDCSSSQGRRSVCDTGGHVFGATVAQRYSSAECRENRSWGFEGNNIWVDKGCRARFRVMIGDAPVVAETIYCASGQMRRNVCRVEGTYITDVSIARRDSNSLCELNKSYGFTEDSVWVDKGCRALFNIYGISGIDPIPFE